MNSFSHVPPGFRFHPTEEELVDYYLRKKVASKLIDLEVIRDVDLYKIEPWDLQELCKIGTEGQNEWYFFSHKDRKYPTGTRTNRATKAGFWKATGRDKAIYSKHCLIGMRKTLVFYKGRAPNGQKSDWIMHEYRLETNENGPPQEEGWVVCRVFKKQLAAIRKFGEYDSPCWYDDQVSFLPEVDYPRQVSQPYDSSYRQQYLCKQELELHYSIMPPHHEALFPQLPQLESPNSVVPHVYERSSNAGSSFQASNLGEDQEHVLQMHRQSNNASIQGNSSEQAHDKVTDWRVLDKFVASQLMSHDDGNNPKDIMNYSNPTAYRVGDQMNCAGSKKPGGPEDLVGVPNSTCQIELWNCEEKPEYEVERYYKDLI